MSDILINSGVTSLGNYSDQSIDLKTIDTNISSVKTLVDGKWKSWTKSTPDIFQGILAVDKGRGFIANSIGNAAIAISDTNLNINDTNISPGLNFLCFPYNNKPISNGILPRIKATTIKTLNGSWVSWVKGAPNAFQGFTDINKNKGYICNIEKVFANYLDNNNRTIDTGVRVGTSYINDINNTSASTLVDFTADSMYKSIDYDIVTVNPDTPKIDLWIKIKDTVKLIKYPIELEGKRFNIKELSLEVINKGLITEAATITEDKGLVTDASASTTDLGDLVGGYDISTIMYSDVFTRNVNNSETNPLIVNDVISISSIELMYDVKTFNVGSTYLPMYINTNGIKFVIEFVTEYTGAPLVIIKDGVVYETTFTNSTTFLTL